MKLPSQETIVAALQNIKNDYCTSCECPEAPDFHAENCPTYVAVSLRFTDDDWEVLSGDSGFNLVQDDPYGANTIGFNDDDDVIDMVACQLLDEAENLIYSQGEAEF